MKKENNDIIDSELSRTFFGKDKKTGAIPSGGKKKRSFLKRLPWRALFILAFLIALVGTSYHYLRDKKIFFDISVKVESLPSAAEDVSHSPSGDMSVLTLFDFESSAQGWEIPRWADEKHDHVAESIKRVTFGSGESSSSSLEIQADFPGNIWTGALVEVEQFLDLSGNEKLFCDIYLPSYAPSGLRAKIILTHGDSWQFTEMSRSIPLESGKWNRIEADISPESRDWRRTLADEAFTSDVRKISVRVESNRIPYKGPFYLDNVSALKHARGK